MFYFDIPADADGDVNFWGIFRNAPGTNAQGQSSGPTSVVFRNADQTAAMGLDLMFGGEQWRRFAASLSGPALDEINEIFDRIAESSWRGAN